ncbi:MAG TPA: hypothetical protein VGI92_11150 [Gemmatimonadales bacterium]|jgi:hypothetical protein
MLAVSICLNLSFAVVGSAQLTPNDRAALGDLGPQYAQHFTLHRGWFRGTAIQYFDIGPQARASLPVFILVTGVDPDGTAHPVPEQRPILPSIPELEGFSALWQVNYIVVGPEYVANQLRDARQVVGLVLAGRARLVVPGDHINYSIVPDGSFLVDDPDNRPLLKGWYKGAEVPYFDFGRTSADPAPIYPFVTGFNGDNPQFLRAQANIVDVVPGSDGGGTHDLWDVTFVIVSASYVPDTIKDRATLLGRADLLIRHAGQVRNCPVVLIGGTRAPR